MDVHVRRLRQALNGNGEDDVIRTVRSAGYAFAGQALPAGPHQPNSGTVATELSRSSMAACQRAMLALGASNVSPSGVIFR